ncbi:unnamed protein product [Caenorhabditis sp. 36 PRJEB53466]|nr:unnamed protein product [Caenorhabditis sp. 36 PRJEB53466]
MFSYDSLKTIAKYSKYGTIAPLASFDRSLRVITKIKAWTFEQVVFEQDQDLNSNLTVDGVNWTFTFDAQTEKVTVSCESAPWKTKTFEEKNVAKQYLAHFLERPVKHLTLIRCEDPLEFVKELKCDSLTVHLDSFTNEWFERIKDRTFEKLELIDSSSCSNVASLEIARKAKKLVIRGKLAAMLNEDTIMRYHVLRSQLVNVVLEMNNCTPLLRMAGFLIMNQLPIGSHFTGIFKNSPGVKMATFHHFLRNWQGSTYDRFGERVVLGSAEDYTISVYRNFHNDDKPGTTSFTVIKLKKL